MTAPPSRAAAFAPLPLAEARRRIGIRSLDAVHPRGLPARGRWLARIERRTSGRPTRAAL